MVAGKAKTKGPISKALAGKLSMREAMEELKRDYRDGVANAADAWVAGELKYLSYYVPQIKEFVNRPEFKNRTPQERIVLALNETSKIAKQYDAERANELNQKIISTYQSAQSGIGSQPSFVKTSSKNTGNVIIV